MAQKRQSIQVGDIFEVSLAQEQRGYLLLLFLYKQFKSVALVACGRDLPALEQQGLAAAFSLQFVFTPALRNGTWKLVGHADLRSDFQPVMVSGFVKYEGDQKIGTVDKLGDLPLMSIGGNGFVVDHLETIIFDKERAKIDNRAIQFLELLRQQYHSDG